MPQLRNMLTGTAISSSPHNPIPVGDVVPIPDEYRGPWILAKCIGNDDETLALAQAQADFDQAQADLDQAQADLDAAIAGGNTTEIANAQAAYDAQFAIWKQEKNDLKAAQLAFDLSQVATYQDFQEFEGKSFLIDGLVGRRIPTRVSSNDFGISLPSEEDWLSKIDVGTIINGCAIKLINCQTAAELELTEQSVININDTLPVGDQLTPGRSYLFWDDTDVWHAEFSDVGWGLDDKSHWRYYAQWNEVCPADTFPEQGGAELNMNANPTPSIDDATNEVVAAYFLTVEVL